MKSTKNILLIILIIIFSINLSYIKPMNPSDKKTISDHLQNYSTPIPFDINCLTVPIHYRNTQGKSRVKELPLTKTLHVWSQLYSLALANPSVFGDVINSALLSEPIRHQQTIAELAKRELIILDGTLKVVIGSMIKWKNTSEKTELHIVNPITSLANTKRNNSSMQPNLSRNSLWTCKEEVEQQIQFNTLLRSKLEGLSKEALQLMGILCIRTHKIDAIQELISKRNKEARELQEANLIQQPLEHGQVSPFVKKGFISLLILDNDKIGISRELIIEDVVSPSTGSNYRYSTDRSCDPQPRLSTEQQYGSSLSLPTYVLQHAKGTKESHMMPNSPKTQDIALPKSPKYKPQFRCHSFIAKGLVDSSPEEINHSVQPDKKTK